jgi:hypothetical protein
MRGKLLGFVRTFLFVVLVTQILCMADTLYRGKTPIKIGHGEQQGDRIIWKSCSNEQDSNYNHPPYSLDKSDNCSVGPPTFGLECEHERCRVVDERKIQKFIPDARNGDEVVLHIGDHEVRLEYKGKVVSLER